MTQAAKFPDLVKDDEFVCLPTGATLRVVVLRVLFFVDMRLPVFSVADLYCLKLFYVIDGSINTIPAS